MHQWILGHRVVSLALLSVVAGCSSSKTGASSDTPLEQRVVGPVVPLDSAQRDERLRALRASHSVENEFDSCALDVDCHAPLRCMSGECRFPDAMVGNVTMDSPSVVVHTDAGPVRFFVELARTPDEQARGLMFRHHMDDEWGMLFVFPRERIQSFWMKNTYLSLDMIFIRKDGVIDSIVERAEPLSLVPRESRGRAMYVLELAGGDAERFGITAGQKIDIVGL